MQDRKQVHTQGWYLNQITEYGIKQWLVSGSCQREKVLLKQSRVGKCSPATPRNSNQPVFTDSARQPIRKLLPAHFSQRRQVRE